jgi:hypothetical protein
MTFLTSQSATDRTLASMVRTNKLAENWGDCEMDLDHLLIAILEDREGEAFQSIKSIKNDDRYITEIMRENVPLKRIGREESELINVIRRAVNEAKSQNRLCSTIDILSEILSTKYFSKICNEMKLDKVRVSLEVQKAQQRNKKKGA